MHWGDRETEGLRWELSHLIDNLNRTDRPLGASKFDPGNVEKRESTWRRFCDTLGNIFPKPLPHALGDARFFSFDKDWNPTPYPAKSWGFLVPKHVSALRQAVHIPPSQHPRLWLMWDNSRILIGIALVLSICGAADGPCASMGSGSISRRRFLGWCPCDWWGRCHACRRNRRALQAASQRNLDVVHRSHHRSFVLASAFDDRLAEHWRPIESDLWKKIANDPSMVDEYLHVPSRFRRMKLIH